MSMGWVLYIVAAGWSITIGAVWLYCTRIAWQEHPMLGAVATFIMGPLAFIFAAGPWLLKAEADSPDLVTLKKGEWACTATLTQTVMVPVSSGKTTTMVPQQQQVCQQYGRI